MLKKGFYGDVPDESFGHPTPVAVVNPHSVFCSDHQPVRPFRAADCQNQSGGREAWQLVYLLYNQWIVPVKLVDVPVCSGEDASSVGGDVRNMVRRQGCHFAKVLPIPNKETGGGACKIVFPDFAEGLYMLAFQAFAAEEPVAVAVVNAQT